MKLLALIITLALAMSQAFAAKFISIDGQTIDGEIESVDANGVIAIKTNAQIVKLNADELAEISVNNEQPAKPGLVAAYLPYGDVVYGEMSAAEPSQVEMASPSLGRILLSLEQILAIEFPQVQMPANADDLRNEMLANESANDFIFSQNGDQLPGIVKQIEPGKLVLQTVAGESSVDAARLFGVSFAARKRAPLPPSIIASVKCADGSLVTGTLLASGAGILKLKLAAGPEVSINAADIVHVQFKQGKLVYLSDLPFAQETYTPFFSGDHTWPWQKNQSYDRKPITLNAKVYQKGIGAFSGGRIAFDLNGEFQRFLSIVGIDDCDGAHQGNATVRILADGTELFKHVELKRESGLIPIDVPVAGVKRIELVVEFGGNMHFGDFVDWANARLIR